MNPFSPTPESASGGLSAGPPDVASRSWGAWPGAEGAWHFALWSPSAQTVTLRLAGALYPMERDTAAVFRASVPAQAGMSYDYLVDGRAVTDPAARLMLGGLDGPAVLFDPSGLRAGRPPGSGRPFDEAVISEIHIGTFTTEGTFAAAAASPQLEDMATLGITAIELLPVAQFPGRMGWGYDVALPFAPHTAYGSPQDLCALIDRAHALGMMVFLDVVFNHFGPKGNPLFDIAPQFFHQQDSAWGRAIDYGQRAVREYYTDCALMWLGDYGFDGLRFDAIDQIEDDSEPEFLVELAQVLRQRLPDRRVHLVTEDNRNVTHLHRPEARLYDAEWNDDYHHAVHVALTGEEFHQFASFAADPLGDLETALRDGFVLQGQPRPPGTEVKGEPSGHLPWTAFVNFNLNHDQAGNRARGERLVTLAGHEKALVAHALLLTAPFTPLLFMGEECGAEAPFLWIADYSGPVAARLIEGRATEFADVPGFAEDMADPMDPAIWGLCHPYAALPAETGAWRAETAKLLALRRDMLLPLWRSGPAGPAETQRLGASGLCVRWPCVLGAVRVAFSFDGTSAWNDPGLLKPSYRQRDPGTGHPWFQLWIEPLELPVVPLGGPAGAEAPLPMAVADPPGSARG